MFYFPDILKYLATDTKNPERQYAAVIDGRLQATNGQIGCYIDVEVFCNDAEQRKNLEGKLFSMEDLSLINEIDVKNITFTAMDISYPRT